MENRRRFKRTGKGFTITGEGFRGTVRRTGLRRFWRTRQVLGEQKNDLRKQEMVLRER